MSRKVEVTRLGKDELAYELTWRGIATGTVEEMRSRLVLAKQLEKSGDSLHYPPYPFRFQEDVAAVTKKLDEVWSGVDVFSDTSKSGAFLKLQTKLNHALGRLDNFICNTPEEFQLRGVLVGQALTMIDQLNSKAALAEGRTNPIPPSLTVLQGSLQTQAQVPVNTAGVPTTSFHQPFVASTPTLPTCATQFPCSSSAIKPILPHKWNLKFGADKKGMSVTAFFERVEELRRARGVSKDILLDSGIDLFVGRAYEFYQSCRLEVQSWDELVAKFKEEYQPAFYAERLLEEIKRRTQGADESIGTYLAIMSKYFQRLECPISEEAKLSILMRNIAPSYRAQLGALDINNIAELKNLCRRIEHRSLAVDYAPPPRKGNSLEPDLAYVADVDEEPSVSTLRVTERNESKDTSSRELICYRCKKPGHKAIGCVLPKPKYCFKCKKEGVTVRQCPNCNQGNAERRS